MAEEVPWPTSPDPSGQDTFFNIINIEVIGSSFIISMLN
jgi:hypothetical protein